MLSKESIEEFQRIWKKEFNQDISYEYANERAGELLGLYRAVYLPVDYQDSLIKQDDERKLGKS